MTTGTPDFNTALQMMADWLVWLDEKEAELDAKIAKSGGGGAAATSAPPSVRGMDAGASLSTGGVPAQAGGHVLPFSPFDEDAPADLPVVVPVADPGWLPPAEPKAVAAQMLDVSDTPDPLGEDDDPSFARWKEGDTPDSLEDDARSPSPIDDLDDPFEDDEADGTLGVASRPPGAQSGRRASEPDADGDEDTQAEDFRQAMQPGPARPPVVINQAPAPRPPSASKPPAHAPAPRPSSPVVRGAADVPVLAVEPATDPLDALETPWGAEAAPELAKRKRRALPELISF
jgi:hypothetical protein